MSLQELHHFIVSAVDAGVQCYRREIEPESDRIKQSDAKRYLRKIGIQPVMLQKWVNARLLTPVKTGEAQNSAVWYSLAEIKSVVSSIELKKICNKNEET